MWTPIGVFLAGVLTSAIASIVLPIIGIGILIAGITYVLGNQEHGKSRLTWSFFGGAVCLLAPSLASALAGAVPH